MVPYHHARWEAFAVLGGFRCTVLELAGRDEFAVLEYAGGIASYRRQTLFREATGEGIPNARVAAAVERALTELNPDVICVNGYSLLPNLVALQWAAAHSIPVVMCSESNRLDSDRNRVKEWVKRRVIGLSSAGMAGGRPQADYLVELGLPKETVFSGYDAVDNSHFCKGSETARRRDDELRRELKLPARYFIACSRFAGKKNIPRLIEAFALYKKRSSKSQKIWDLVIVGDGELRPLIEEVVQRFGVIHSVHLVGAKPYDVLPAYYALAGALIHASTTEQWGLVVNEAMASGLPVLVSNRCGCVTDLVWEGKNGFTFDPYDVEALAQLMIKISTDDFPLSEFGLTSRKIITNWGPERFASGMKAAAECALKVGAKRAGLFDRVLLKALSHR